LVSLQDLELKGLQEDSLPEGCPSTLTALTHLHITNISGSRDWQFQHLSSLTALQDLSVQSTDIDSDM
jgi:hypothetical protein